MASGVSPLLALSCRHRAAIAGALVNAAWLLTIGRRWLMADSALADVYRAAHDHA